MPVFFSCVGFIVICLLVLRGIFCFVEHEL